MPSHPNGTLDASQNQRTADGANPPLHAALLRAVSVAIVERSALDQIALSAPRTNSRPRV